MLGPPCDFESPLPSQLLGGCFLNRGETPIASRSHGCQEHECRRSQTVQLSSNCQSHMKCLPHPAWSDFSNGGLTDAVVCVGMRPSKDGRRNAIARESAGSRRSSCQFCEGVIAAYNRSSTSKCDLCMECSQDTPEAKRSRSSDSRLGCIGLAIPRQVFAQHLVR